MNGGGWWPENSSGFQFIALTFLIVVLCCNKPCAAIREVPAGGQVRLVFA